MKKFLVTALTAVVFGVSVMGTTVSAAEADTQAETVAAEDSAAVAVSEEAAQDETVDSVEAASTEAENSGVIADRVNTARIEYVAGGVDTYSPNNRLSKVWMFNEGSNVENGDVLSLKCVSEPRNDRVIWKCSNTNILKLSTLQSSGEITLTPAGLGKTGTVTLTGTSVAAGNKKVAKIKIVVQRPAKAISIRTEYSETGYHLISVGSKRKIALNLITEHGDNIKPTVKKVNWRCKVETNTNGVIKDVTDTPAAEFCTLSSSGVLKVDSKRWNELGYSTFPSENGTTAKVTVWAETTDRRALVDKELVSNRISFYVSQKPVRVTGSYQNAEGTVVKSLKKNYWFKNSENGQITLKGDNEYLRSGLYDCTIICSDPTLGVVSTDSCGCNLKDDGSIVLDISKCSLAYGTAYKSGKQTVIVKFNDGSKKSYKFNLYRSEVKPGNINM
jgi:uncharacterized protein YndB with AHSA1/START domain